MNLIKIISLTFLLSLSANILCSQNTTEDLTTEFFEKYKKDTDDAFKSLFSTNSWMSKNEDVTQNLRFKVRDYSALMGEYLEAEKIGEKSLGRSLKIVVFMVKYERQPLRYVFKFYKPKNEWVIFHFSIDENITEDLEAVMKYEYLNY